MGQVDHLGERLRWASYASIGAGVVHGAAVGLHAEHLALSRVFLALTLLQVSWGVAVLVRRELAVLMAGAVLNLVAVGGWVVTRTLGIGFIGGLETVEKPQAADTLCALLGLTSVVALGWAWSRRHVAVPQSFVLNAAYLTAAVTVVAMVSVTGHVHDHGHEELALVDSGLSVNADGVIVSATGEPTTTVTMIGSVGRVTESRGSKGSATTIATGPTTTVHPHSTTPAQGLAAASGWPRPYDPDAPMDFSGIAGVTAEQRARAENLLANTVKDLPTYANHADAIAAGYKSIGDGSTGFEHLINYSLLSDGRVLDTKAPESLVYQVIGSTKKLVSAMYIANPGTPINDATLVNYGGGLMQWHVHTNLCWTLVGGVPKVVGVTDANGNCPIGSTRQTNGSPMVHVWISANKCGPFAALEGVGAGLADVPDNQRVDMCNAAH